MGATMTLDGDFDRRRTHTWFPKEVRVVLLRAPIEPKSLAKMQEFVSLSVVG
jgi:hypothetical protein